MHRDVVTHVAVSAADFFITGSADGIECSIIHYVSALILIEICCYDFFYIYE